MHRRDFLKHMAALGLAAGTGQLVLPEEVWAMAPQEKPQPIVAKVQGTNYAQLAGDAIQALGGMKKFVQPGQVVVVKPNMAWDRPPDTVPPPGAPPPGWRWPPSPEAGPRPCWA